MTTNDPNAQGALVDYLQSSFRPEHEHKMKEKLDIGWHRVHVRDAPYFGRPDSYAQYNTVSALGHYQSANHYFTQQQFPVLINPIYSIPPTSFYHPPRTSLPGNTSSGSSAPSPPFSS